jgi:hypothetical protein
VEEANSYHPIDLASESGNKNTNPKHMSKVDGASRGARSAHEQLLPIQVVVGTGGDGGFAGSENR